MSEPLPPIVTTPDFTTPDFTGPEKAAWRVAVDRGLSIEAADLRALIEAAIPRCPTPCDKDCEQACHEVHCIPRRRGHNPEACVGTLSDAIRALERERIYAELGNDHYVIFTKDRWTVEHSVECRLSGRMHECEYHVALRKVTGRKPRAGELGRWRITGIDSEGLPDLERANPAGGSP